MSIPTASSCNGIRYLTSHILVSVIKCSLYHRSSRGNRFIASSAAATTVGIAPLTWGRLAAVGRCRRLTRCCGQDPLGEPWTWSNLAVFERIWCPHLILCEHLWLEASWLVEERSKSSMILWVHLWLVFCRMRCTWHQPSQLLSSRTQPARFTTNQLNTENPLNVTLIHFIAFAHVHILCCLLNADALAFN